MRPLRAQVSISELYAKAGREAEGIVRVAAYYSAGNSKIKYKHNGTSTAANWWLRSPYASSSYRFVLVYTDGTVDGGNAYYSLGFAPGFYIDTGQTE